MIHYDIDTTENGYDSIEGNAATVDELKKVLLKDSRIQDMIGYLSIDEAPEISICIAAESSLGFFISITDDTDDTQLTLGDRNALSDTIDLWGDELYVSKGLFIPFEDGWSALEEYINNGKLSDKINWISSADIPEDGNYIC